MKDEFVSLVSHELRTPLTSIQGYVALLNEESGSLSAKQKRFLAVLDRNSERLLDLVGDLLFLAKVDAGEFAIALDDVDLGTIVEESIESCRPIAHARGIEIATSIASLPRLSGDRARLAQVLDNLISNALKFTPDGGRVEVTLATGNGRAVLEVTDNGIGVPSDEQSRLFDRFFRSSQAASDAIPGSGLGLAITKAIVEGHGGQIALESEENHGTTVRVELPLGAPVEPRTPLKQIAVGASF
jgi:signal transduction histidine kinase